MITTRCFRCTSKSFLTHPTDHATASMNAQQQVYSRMWFHFSGTPTLNQEPVPADRSLLSTCQTLIGRWDVPAGCARSPGVGCLRGAAGDRRAPTEESALGSASLQRAARREDCDSDGSQHRSVTLTLLLTRVQGDTAADLLVQCRAAITRVTANLALNVAPTLEASWIKTGCVFMYVLMWQ